MSLKKASNYSENNTNPTTQMADKRNLIERMNYVAGYVINETPTYRPVIDSSSFDMIPNMGEADETQPQEEPEAQAGAPEQGAQQPPVAPAPSTEPPAGSPESALAAPGAPTPAAPSTSINPPLPDAQVSPAAPPVAQTPEQPAQQQGTTDQLQADVMRFQLDAMKKMTQKMDELEQMVSSLNAQNAELHKEVENVRDPSDIEKFSNRKQDSSPYYFNLNDMWNGNTFQARMDNYNSKGIVKTKDGYIADFDQLPKLNAYELKDSFEQI